MDAAKLEKIYVRTGAVLKSANGVSVEFSLVFTPGATGEPGKVTSGLLDKLLVSPMDLVRPALVEFKFNKNVTDVKVKAQSLRSLALVLLRSRAS